MREYPEKLPLREYFLLGHSRLHVASNVVIMAQDGSIETPPRAHSPVHRFGTLAVHAGSPHDPVTGAVIESVSDACLTFLEVRSMK